MKTSSRFSHGSIGALFVSIGLAAAPYAARAQAVNPWSVLPGPIQTPSGKSEVFGNYNLGCVSNAVPYAATTDGWELVTIERHRNFSHPELHALVTQLADWSVNKARFGKLILGDVAQPAGGPMSSHHVSHQVGLDVDIRFKFYPKGKTMTPSERRNWPNPPVATHQVVRDTSRPLGYRIKTGLVANQWNDAYAAIVAQAATYSKVERIFVSPAIKKVMCDMYKPQAGGAYPAWLKKVSPYYGHDEHFHVRIKCPTTSAGCVPQAPIGNDPTDPTKVGCAGDRLKFWFDESGAKGTFLADTIYAIQHPTPPPTQPPWVAQLGKVPQECKDLLASAGRSPLM